MKQPAASEGGTDGVDEKRLPVDDIERKPDAAVGEDLSSEGELSSDEERAIEERLRYLGYID